MANPLTEIGPAHGYALYYLTHVTKVGGEVRRLNLTELRERMRQKFVHGTFTQALVNQALRIAQQNALATDRIKQLEATGRIGLVFGAAVPRTEVVGLRVKLPVLRSNGEMEYTSVTVNARADATPQQIIDAAKALVNSGQLSLRVAGSPEGQVIEDVEGLTIDKKPAVATEIFQITRQRHEDPSLDMS